MIRLVVLECQTLQNVAEIKYECRREEFLRLAVSCKFIMVVTGLEHNKTLSITLHHETLYTSLQTFFLSYIDAAMF